MDSMKTVIIKVGTGVLTRQSDGCLDDESLARLVKAVAGVAEQGHRVMMVSSGAVGAGISGLGLSEYPADIATLVPQWGRLDSCMPMKISLLDMATALLSCY